MKKSILILMALCATLVTFSQVTRDFLYKVDSTTGDAVIVKNAHGDSLLVEFPSQEMAQHYHDSVVALSQAIKTGQSTFKNISTSNKADGQIVMITLPNGTTMSEAAFLALPPRVQKRMMKARQSVMYASNGSTKIRLTAEQPMGTPVATNYDRQSGYLSNQTSVKKLYVNEYGQLDQYSETKKRGFGQLVFELKNALVNTGQAIMVGKMIYNEIFGGQGYYTGMYGGNQYLWLNNLMYMLQGESLMPCNYINPMYMTSTAYFNGTNFSPVLQSSGVRTNLLTTNGCSLDYGTGRHGYYDQWGYWHEQ